MDENLYLANIKKHLHLDNKTEERIIEDLRTDLHFAINNGESIDDILGRMGSAKSVANDYNQSYKNDSLYQSQHRFKLIKRIAIITLIITLILFGISLFGMFIFTNSDNISMTGGYSAPTNIITTSKVISPLMWLNIIKNIAFIPLIVFVLSATYCITITVKNNKGG